MTRNQAIEIARQRALNAREGHGYLPVTEADAQTWMPHEWVIDAILLATMQCDLAAQQPCQYCNDTGDVHGLDGEWQGTCTACKWGAARPAAQPVALTVDEKAALDRALLRSVKIVDEAAQPVAKPDGRLHDDGLFTWARRDGYVLDAKLPCDFYLSAQPQQAEPVADVCTDPDNCKRCKTHPNHRGDLSHAGIGWYPPAQPQQAADVVLTDAEMSDIARDAQIAYFMDKYSSFVMAYARSVEAAVLKKIGGAA